jgi:PHD/YefM family antitoxin component YafN of YafNO toxin-antitoxin module
MRTVGNVQFASISEAKTNLPKLAEASKPTVLLRRNKPVAALVSIDQYNDYLALEKLIRNPAAFDRLREKAQRARTTPTNLLRNLEEFEERFRSKRDNERATDADTSAL